MILPMPAPGPVPPSRRQVRVVWLAMAAALVAAVVAAIAGSTLVPANEGSSQLATIFLVVSAPLTAIELAMAYFVTGRLRRRPPPGADPESVASSQVIIASALPLGATFLSCVFFFVAREPLQLLLAVPCAAVLLHWRPTEARWARLLPTAPGAPGPRRMIRE
jgi:FtsH-binding integral membrane protein